MDDSTIALLFAFLFPIAFLAMWCGIVFALGAFGGWRRLARAYRATGEPGGESFHWQTGRVGSVPYRHMLNVQAAASGIHLSVPLPFRVGHPDLMIPWSAVHDEQHAKVWGREVTRFEVGQVGRIELPTRVMQSRSRR